MTIEEIRDVFEYNPLTGRLHWRIRIGGSSSPGKVIGTLDKDGYYLVGYKGVKYRVARIIYAWLHGSDPGKFQVDHINRIRTDDCAWNLRLATRATNQHNRTNTCYQHFNRWVVQYSRYGVRTRKSFATKAEADEYISTTLG